MIMGHRPIRVLHVLGALNQGGVETWLVNVLRNIDRSAFQIDFLVHTNLPAAYDHEVQSLGSRIFPCLNPSRLWQYASQFKTILREQEPYDVVHSHVHWFSGRVLRLAKTAGVPIRIAHSHLDSTQIDRQSGLLRKPYLTLMKHWIECHATDGLGCGRRAAASLFGTNWENDGRWKLLYCGIDVSEFDNQEQRSEVRKEFHIPQDATLLGHVGRFEYQKNHSFLIEILRAAIQSQPQTHLLLIGDGPLRQDVERQVNAFGLQNHVIFAGLRRDVPRLMSGLDVFLLPSHYEGLPIVLLEAQATGLPCVISDTVDDEATVISQLVQRLSLSQPASAWSKAIENILHFSKLRRDFDSRKCFLESPFHIRTGVERLQQLYAKPRSHMQETNVNSSPFADLDCGF